MIFVRDLLTFFFGENTFKIAVRNARFNRSYNLHMEIAMALRVVLATGGRVEDVVHGLVDHQG